MMAIGYQKWRPLAGVLAVGMFAFGLSLQSAPAGRETAGKAGLDRFEVLQSIRPFRHGRKRGRDGSGSFPILP